MKKIPLTFIITVVRACFPLSKSHADVSDCNITIAPTVINYGDFTSTELEQSEFTHRNVSVNIFCPTLEKKLKFMVTQPRSILSFFKTDKSKIILKLNSSTLNGKSINIQLHTIPRKP